MGKPSESRLVGGGLSRSSKTIHVGHCRLKVGHTEEDEEGRVGIVTVDPNLNRRSLKIPFGTLAKGVKVPTEQLFHEQFCLGGVSDPISTKEISERISVDRARVPL